jgi:broad specificity phosphatase PhoE
MSPGLILVRHAMSAVDPAVPSRFWGLTESAREDCVLLAEHLRGATLAPAIMTSDEPKARETATILGLRLGIPVEVDAGLAEADRPYIDGDYRSLALRYVGGEPHTGWEPRESVVIRFASAVERARSRHPAGDLVVVNHGLALTLFLASFPPVHVGDVAVPFDGSAFWAALTFPDAWRYDPEQSTFTRLFEAGLPPTRA